MVKLMMIIGDEKVMAEIEEILKKNAVDWYNAGTKEFDADVKVFDLGDTKEFHLG